MKIIYRILPLVFLFSCGLSEEQENDLTAYYTYNYEFAKGKGDMIRHSIEGMRAESMYAVKDTIYKRVKIAERMMKNVIKDINVCLNQNNFQNTDSIFENYTVTVDSINTFVENDKNYIFTPLPKGLYESSPKVLVLRMKSDLASAYSNFMEYVHVHSSVGCGGWGFALHRDIETSSTTDSLGNTTIILHSKGFQNFETYGLTNALIIEELTLNGKKVEKELYVSENKAFANLGYKELEKGKYKIKGKINIYTRKGEKDYPFSHEFEVK